MVPGKVWLATDIYRPIVYKHRPYHPKSKRKTCTSVYKTTNGNTGTLKPHNTIYAVHRERREYFFNRESLFAYFHSTFLQAVVVVVKCMYIYFAHSILI